MNPSFSNRFLKQLVCFKSFLTCLICFISTVHGPNSSNSADVPLSNKQMRIVSTTWHFKLRCAIQQLINFCAEQFRANDMTCKKLRERQQVDGKEFQGTSETRWIEANRNSRNWAVEVAERQCGQFELNSLGRSKTVQTSEWCADVCRVWHTIDQPDRIIHCRLQVSKLLRRRLITLNELGLVCIEL